MNTNEQTIEQTFEPFGNYKCMICGKPATTLCGAKAFCSLKCEGVYYDNPPTFNCVPNTEHEEFDKFMRQSSDSHYVLHNNTNGEHISIDIQNPHKIDDLIKMIKSNDNLQIIQLNSNEINNRNNNNKERFQGERPKC